MGFKDGNPRVSVMKKSFFAFLALAALSTMATAKEPLNVEVNRVAIQGHDPVAFFTGRRCSCSRR